VNGRLTRSEVNFEQMGFLKTEDLRCEKNAVGHIFYFEINIFECMEKNGT
jgi:hypothetical protein